ncbi:MAG: ABC transporter permease [Caldilineales bacterium]|nr:ABC transporter permease [Caldilineales bacterium]
MTTTEATSGQQQGGWASRLRSSALREGVGLLAMYLIIVLVMYFLSDVFLSKRNFLNLLLASSVMGIIAMVTTMLMVGGGLDLSVGSTVALVGVIISHSQNTLGVWGGAAAGLLAALIVGIANGLIVTRVGINALITTLGMFSIVRGLAFVFSGGLTEPVLDPAFGNIGRSFLSGIPIPVLIFTLVILATYIIMRFTQYGRAMYMVGGNAAASHLAGLKVKNFQFIAFVLSGLSAGVAGVILTSMLGAGAPQAASGLELSVIAAVILGGTSLAGGKGTILGTLIGILILGTLNNGMVLLSVSAYYQQIAQGLVLLLAVGLDQLRLRRTG